MATDLDALAAKHGGSVDYDALAAKHGAAADHSDIGFIPDHADIGFVPDAQPGFLSSLYDSTIGGVVNLAHTYSRHVQENEKYGAMMAPVAGAVDTLGDMGKGLYQQAADSLKTVPAAFAKGNYFGSGPSVSKGIMGAVPVIGPAAVQVENQLDSGNLAGAAGTALGTGLTIGGPKVLGKLASAKIPLQVASKLNPVEQAAVDYASQRGIPLDLGTATGNKTIQNAQQLSANLPFGAKVASNAKQATNTALASDLGSQASAAASTPATAESAGSSITDALTAKANAYGKAADTAYGQFRQIEADPQNAVPVQIGNKQVVTRAPNGSIQNVQSVPDTQHIPLATDMRQAKAGLAPILQQMRQALPIAQQQANPALKAIENVVTGPDYVPASVAETNLSAIKSIQRSATGSQLHMAGQTIDKLNDAIQAAAAQDKTGQAMNALQAGRSATAAKYSVLDTADSLPVNEPVQVFSKLTANDDRNINLLRQVAQKTPAQIPQIGRAYLQGMFDDATAQGGFNGADRMYANWNRLGDATKQTIFNPDQVKQLDNFFQLAKMSAKVMNTSGTAPMTTLANGIGMVVINPVHGVPMLIGNAALSRMMFNPEAVAALTRGMKIPVGQKAAAMLQANRIVSIAGNAAQPLAGRQTP